MEFRILGPLEVRASGAAVAVTGAKLRAVLVVLALHANRPVSVERLAVALWGEDAPPGAVKAVQVHVSRLRRALGETDVLVTTPAGYRLVVGPEELDAERFERAVVAGREALAAGDPGRAGSLLRDALGLWRGAPLEEFAWAPFAPAEMERLEELRLGAIESRVEADLAAGGHAELVAELKQLTAEHPWREHVYVQLMVALYRSGRQAEALEVYRRARRVLVEQFGIEPGSELCKVHQAVLVHDAALELEPGVGSARLRRGALPSLPNRTIGRAREVRAVAERLRGRAVPLLTLTGPGGVGKTRLALEAARSVEADFADGAWFVSLAALQRGRDVGAAIVSSLAIVPLAGESAEETIERFLAAKHLLLVVDNCEHLPTAAPFIGRLSAAGPGITVLATSREPLAVQAEQVQLVRPLGLPEPGMQIDLDALAGVDAVALFCERAQAHDPDFELCEENAVDVVAICRRLDGLPLAIELAAARCVLLSPAEIAARLRVALGALGTGARDAPARHQTLRATLDWSHGLLDADEKAGFARFAAFAGGATVQAAEEITGAGLQTLDRLVAKSLLVRRRHPHGPTRLGMLETVRAYAAERFAALPDRESVRERHFDYFRSLARRDGVEPALDGPNRGEHLACLDGEVDNLRAALHWAAERDAWGRVLELSAALVDYWMRRDRYAEAVDWIVPALRTSDAGGDPALRARALCKACWPLWALGRTDEILALLSEVETITPTLADPAIRAEVLYSCATLWSGSGRLDLAVPIADEALVCAKVSGDAWTIAMAAWARALVAGRGAGNAEELRARVDEAAPLLEHVGNAYHLALLFANAASCSLRRGWDGEADVYLRRAVPLVGRLDQPFVWMMVREKVALAALFAGDTEAAHDAFREELLLSHELALVRVASQALTGLAAVAAVDDDPARAGRLAGAAAAHRHAANDDVVTARLEATFLKPARNRFGAAAWDAAAGEGGALSLEEAIADALEQSPPHAGSVSSRYPLTTAADTRPSPSAPA